jgi:hypothetical protein
MHIASAPAWRTMRTGTRLLVDDEGDAHWENMGATDVPTTQGSMHISGWIE